MEELAIATTRLQLRQFRLGDVDDLHRLWNEPGVRKYLWDDRPVPRELVESIVERSVALFRELGFGLWAVLPKTADELFGFLRVLALSRTAKAGTDFRVWASPLEQGIRH